MKALILGQASDPTTEWSRRTSLLNGSCRRGAAHLQGAGFGRFQTSGGPYGVFLGVYLMSVSRGHQADLAEPHRPNRNLAKASVYN